jgi:3-oxoacyl-[acyl-carrier-protein] synthase I
MITAHIVALAARTPVGLRAESTAAAVRARVSRIGDHPIFVDASGEPVRCGRDALLAPALMGAERLVALARAALREAAEKLAGQKLAGLKPPVWLVLPEARPGFDGADARRVVQTLAAEELPDLGKLDVRAVGPGHAGGFAAFEQALSRIRQRQDELALVGGVDSYLDGAALDWLEQDRRLDCAEARGGFPPGEGAAFVVLASDSLRRHLKLPSLAVVRAIACTTERRDPASAESVQGQGLTEAFEAVAAALARPHEKFDDSYTDLNGERVRNHDLSFALLRAGGFFRDGTAYHTAVSSVGDLGAATAPLNCLLAARAWARGYATGGNALVYGASWGGARGALLLGRPE